MSPASTSRASRTFAALRVRNFRWFFGAQCLSQIGSWFQMVAQIWLVAEMTGSGVALGLVTALQALPFLFLTTYGGALADRLPTRRVLLVTQSLLAAVATAMAVLSATDVLTVGWIYALALVAGTVNAFDRPAASAFLYEMVGPEDLSSAVGLGSVEMSTGRLVGPALAGVLLASVGATACFAINGVSFAIVIVALLRLRTSELVPRTRSGQSRPKVMEAIRYVRGVPELLWPIVACAVVGCLAFNFLTVMTAMVRFEFDAGSDALGAVESLNALFAIPGGLLIAGVHRPTIRLAGLVTLAFSAALALNALAPTLGWYLLVMPFFGMSVAAFMAVTQSVVQRNAAPEMQGRVASLYMLALMGTSPLGALIAGVLIDISPRAAWAMGASGTLVSAVLLLVVSRTHRGEDSQPEVVGGVAVGLGPDEAVQLVG